MRIPVRRLLAHAAILACAHAASAAGYPPAVGQPHPDFRLPSIEHRAPVSLAQFRGRKVLLIQFASW